MVIVFFLLDKGHEAEHLQKECLFLLLNAKVNQTLNRKSQGQGLTERLQLKRSEQDLKHA